MAPHAHMSEGEGGGRLNLRQPGGTQKERRILLEKDL